MENKKLLNTEEKQNRLLDLFLLKSATEWLEKQNWISSPYGGDNYLEDVIFRIKLLSGQEWQTVFQDELARHDYERLNEYFELLKTIDPSIKNFCDSVLNATSPLRIAHRPADTRPSS
jgi:hypothetical protein